MAFWTRKRSRSEGIYEATAEAWDEHAEFVKDAVAREYAAVSRVYLAAMHAALRFPLRARIPLDAMSKLSTSSVCATHAAVESRDTAQPPFLCMQVKFSDNMGSSYHNPKQRRMDSATNPAVASDADADAATLKDIGAHASEIKRMLRLRNGAAVEAVERVIRIVRSEYEREMNWESGFPYEMVFQKKHNQIIIRFRLLQQNPTLHSLPFAGLNATGWVEYDKATHFFWLIVVVRDCV